MTIETTEQFLARGGKVTKSVKKDASLEELLKKEALMDESGAKAIASLLSNTISEKLNTELKSKQD